MINHHHWIGTNKGDIVHHHHSSSSSLSSVSSIIIVITTIIIVMSLEDVVGKSSPPPPSPPPPSSRQSDDQISGTLLDEISIPNISAQMFDFCDPDIFSDTLQNSEVTSSPTCYSYEDQNDSKNTNNNFSTENIDLLQQNNTSTLQGEDYNDQNTLNTVSSTSSTTTTAANTLAPPCHHQSTGILPVIFDTQVEIDSDISASIDFSPSPYNNFTTNTTQLENYQFNQYTDNNNNIGAGSSVDPVALPLMVTGPPPPPPIGPFFEGECMSSIPPPPPPHFMRINNHNPSVTSAASSPTLSYLDPSMTSFLHGNLNPENSGIFSGTLLMPSDLQPNKEIDFHDHQLVRYNSGDMQAFSNESSQLGSATTSSAPMTSEISSLEDSTFKVGKLSAEQRKEKIHRYLKKRNERNFSKKIKYACRKTLADSRPRVRGRFAKNDEFGESSRHINHHEEDEYDELQVPAKEEEAVMMDPSELFAHINGVNSFKCNFQQIQSWI